jgi:hypothetical protein
MRRMSNKAWGTGRNARDRSGRLRKIAVLVAALLQVISFARSAVPADSLNEYQVKAAFLFNFAKFIDWPDDTYSSPQAPFAICVLGKDPFGPTLDESLAGKTMNDHPVTVLRLKERSAARHCQMVFISSTESPNYGVIFESLRGASVVLVGETEGFAASGGTIEFFLDQDHVRFAINPETARRANLKFSSRLLALAKIVHAEQAAGKS